MLAFPIVPAYAPLGLVPMGLVPLGQVVWVEQTERNKQDLDLLSRIQRRDERALAALYDRYASLLYTMAVRIVSMSEEAEDILQEVFVQIWSKSNLYAKERGSVYSWIAALCRNKAIDRVRSKRYKQHSKEVKLEEAAQTADVFAAMNPHHSVVLKEYQDVVAAAKSKLSDIEAKILDLSYFGGYSQTEISQLLKMPLGTVKTKMRQGMINLRRAVMKDSSGAITLNDTNDSEPGEEAQVRSQPRRRRGRRGGRNRRHGPSGGGHSQNSPGRSQGSEGSPTS